MKLSGRSVRSVVWVVLLLAGSLVCRAQEVSGTISGTIQDATGANVSGATVVITDTDRAHVERTLKTTKAGYYTAPSLPLGTYSVTITMTGFKKDLVTGVVLNANDDLKIDQKLSVGASDQTVTVVASEAALNLEDGMSEGLINGTQLRELVLNNRNYEQLLNLQPGVSFGGASDQLYVGTIQPSGSSNQVNFSVNGGRNTTNNWTIDGADNVDRGANLTLLAFPSVDAIAEFKTLRGTYKAEFGRSASAQINVVTMSGTNALHGSGYEFFRNNIFNANNYFNKLTAAGYIQRPLLRYNDFGFTVGGPVVIPHLYHGKDKTFFFYSQEFRRVINYTTSSALVPTQAERAGDFTNGFVGTGSTAVQGPVAVCSAFATATGACTAYASKLTVFSPTALAYIKDIYGTGATPNVPYPNSAADLSAGLDPHTLTFNSRNVINDTQEFARVDHSFGTRVNVFYRYLHDSFPTAEGLGFGNGAAGLPGVGTTADRAPGTQHMGHITIAVKPEMLLDMGYAFSSGAVISVPVGLVATANSPDVKPILPFASTLGVVPNISFSGNAQGISSSGLYNDYNRNHNGFGSITQTFKQHTFKAGITYNHYQKMENATGTAQGTFTFATATPNATQATGIGGIPGSFDSTFADFLIGNANGGFTQASAALTPNINENIFEMYVQDDWRATRRLTVNLGVRYSFFGQPYDDGGLLSNFDPATYKPALAPTVDSNGALCTTASQSVTTTSTTGTTSTTITPCANTTNLGGAFPNTLYDALNGIILGTPSVAYPTHGSPYGLEVGRAQKDNFAPRFGFAYDLYGDGKTSLRGGYGISYDESEVSFYETSVFGNIPYVNVPNYTTALFDNPAGGATAQVNLAPPTVSGSPVEYTTPYIQQYSLDIQQAITPTMTLDVGYFGDKGTHLLGKIDINEVQPGLFQQKGLQYNAVPGCSAFTSQTCERQLGEIRPYVGYTAINTVEPIFSSNYNALQVKFTKRFSGKSYIDANYSFSRSLTNSQSDYSTAPQNIYNINADYGRAAQDRNTIITLDGVWELPWMRDQHGILGHAIGGWQLSSIVAIDSGLPLTVGASSGSTITYGTQTSAYNPILTNGGLVSDSAGLGILGPSAAGLRPNQVLDPNDGYGQLIHKRLNWFNRAAFVAPSPSSYQVGNEKRGSVTGPGFNRIDVGVFRNFRITERVAFQLRGEAFNTLNHTNWQTVGVTATSSTFGTVTATRDPRIMQVGGKVNF